MAKIQYTWNPFTDSVIEETDGVGAVDTTYTNKPLPFGPLVSQESGGIVSHFHFDALGSTRLATDTAQSVVAVFVFGAFGDTINSTSPSLTDYQWNGQWGYSRSLATDSYYVRSRILCPLISRWSSVDPYSFFDGLLRYRYATNSPTRLTDPTGLFTAATTPDVTATPQIAGPCPSIPYGQRIPQNTSFGLSELDTFVLNNLKQTYKYKKNVYIQKVTISIKQSFGVNVNGAEALSAVNCANASVRSRCECDTCSVSYTFSWVEALAQGDQQSLLVEEIAFNILKRECRECANVNPCCGWEYTRTVNKEVVPFLYRYTTTHRFLSGTASVQCADGKVKAVQLTDGDSDSPLTYPGKSKRGISDSLLKYPSPDEQVVGPRFYENRTLIEHPECGDATGSTTWKEYRSVAEVLLE